MLLAAGVMGGLALFAQGVPAKPQLPSAAGPSPQAARVAKVPPPPQPGRPSKAELVSRCEQRPSCHAKLELALKGLPPAIVRPAASGPTRQELELRKLPALKPPPVPRRFQRNALRFGIPDGLLAWFNPFHLPAAEAQPRGVSLYLTPQNPEGPGTLLEMDGIFCRGIYCYFGSGTRTADPDYENGTGAHVEFTAPAAGWYIVDFRGSRAPAKVRHQSGGPIIETWEQVGAPCEADGICHYLTAEFLQPGSHTFYLYVTPSWAVSLYFFSASVESYP